MYQPFKMGGDEGVQGPNTGKIKERMDLWEPSSDSSTSGFRFPFLWCSLLSFKVANPFCRAVWKFNTLLLKEQNGEFLWLQLGSKGLEWASGFSLTPTPLCGRPFILRNKIWKLLSQCVCVHLVTESYQTFCDPRDYSPPGSSVHGDSPGTNPGGGCHALLQGVFQTQGSNPDLPHYLPSEPRLLSS